VGRIIDPLKQNIQRRLFLLDAPSPVCLAHAIGDFKIRYPDNLPKDTLPKDILPKDILPNGHFADGNFAERTFCRTDILPNGHFSERTVCRKDNWPKIEMLFRQNVWNCAPFLNFAILNHCVKLPLYGH
jgi:hypothetical protein